MKTQQSNSLKHRKLHNEQGLTLVEVMVSMVLLTMVFAGVMGAVLTTRKMAESNIYENTALSAAMGYMEQMKGINYVNMKSAMADPDGTPIPTQAISALIATSEDEDEDISTDDFLYLNVANEKDILIDIKNPGTDEEERIVMKFRITPTLTDLGVGSDPKEALHVQMDYEFRSPVNARTEWQKRSIETIRSKVDDS